jgi:hypothetical protein
MKKMPLLAIVSLTALLLQGCATSPDRIAENQALFDSYPPETQQLIRDGKVQLGFTADMVLISLGEPDRKYIRHAAQANSIVWAYTDYTTRTQRQRITGRFRVRDPQSGLVQTVEDSVWADVATYHEYDQLRVELLDGQVVAVEQHEP